MITQQLLSPAYFGPIQYFTHLLNQAVIEQHGHYTRQTFRNRCVISGPNGLLTLSVPVEKGTKHNIPDKEVRIAYHTPWQRMQWRSLVSSYNASPFFQYYQDDLHPFFTKKIPFLFDLNLEVTHLMMELTGIESKISLTDSYRFSPGADIHDLREIIHPKKEASRHDPCFSPAPYKQVFDQRHGFLPNLSILDLLFNKGPESILILEQSLLNRSQPSAPCQ